MSIDQGDNGRQTLVRPPSHPVPQLQKPFEESMMESISDQGDQDVPMDAMARRTMLLEAPTYQRVIAGRWKQKPGEIYHPLWKLVAQMSFGVHLLAENMAISEEEVMRILQSHVDDIDGFLERTTEDFDLAQSDIHERIRCLKLPLAHGDVFDRMLEDRTFRASILDGNERIDHVITRTKRAAKDALKDVQKGFDATSVLEKYLSKLNSKWKRESPEHEAVLVAMLGNVEGWRRAFLELHLQGNKLSGSLKKLAEVVAEMQRRAAAVSRNVVVSSVHHTAPVLSLPSNARQARAQKPKHISSQKTNGASSHSDSIADQKPLPTEPGRQHSARNSSRSTQLTSFSSRPNSGQKSSSQGLTSQSPSAGHQSPRSPGSKRNAQAERVESALSPEAKALDVSRAEQATERMQSLGGLLIQFDNDHPIELPADVPEGALRQAPVSVKNRLSMTLGLKSKDNSDHRISSIYYPRALSDLLKTPPISHLLPTPQSAKPKGTPVHALTGFTSREQSPAIGVIDPDSKKEVNSNKVASAVGKSARASIAETSAGTRPSSVLNSAFTSHPAVMAMASPPAELPVTAGPEERPPSSQSRKDSKPSSLGEPGPALPEDMATRSASISGPQMLVDTSIVTVAVTPASAEKETFATAEQKAEHTGLVEKAEETKNAEAVKEEVVAIALQSQDTMKDGDEVKPKTDEKEAEKEIHEHTPPPPKADVDKPETQFLAELEAIVPEPPVPISQQDFGPVELEAPHQTFKLPPRPIAVSTNPDKEVPRASIQQLDDFFKLPTELTIKPGMKPKDFGDSTSPEPIRPLKLKLAKKDGKIVPVQVSGPGGSQKVGSPGSKLRMDVVADIIETMSHTPPGSPIHARSASSASSNSAQRWSHRSSRSLGPPDQAPAPPGPGGRPMVNPDFAAAGQFEGERKQKKSSSRSKSGWKSFFSGSTNATRSSGTSITTNPTTEATASTTRPNSEAATSKNMMTTSGKEVLWFKGDTKKTLGVSSA
ncbi:uncharacterized protein Z518_04042 [Rhinocladiella mackenziei CBS 650.93]|uniref:Uncharacterized protein n=1 Tax=Rhinocladiella mackenziei CBS 650.93 TaxID=1442369 RepID=A0A0D2H6Q2_9EURO|nr:uncharacterized protein Z518_04042 [Rhinocladiella mackenziei CBS 650.93]KIX06068.1 hypothetical protein Z518_04042 [Rhinocladiella mackenziei CBS 650.93]